MASGINYSIRTADFKEEPLKERVGIGAFETLGFYIRAGAVYPESKRKDRDLRTYRAGKSPDGSSALKRLMEEPKTLYGEACRGFRNSIKTTGSNIDPTPTHSNSFEQSQPQVPETKSDPHSRQ